MMDARARLGAKHVYRGSQVIFGERAHLWEVLRSIERAKLPRARMRAESKALARLIEARTAELNRLHPAWDRNYKKARHRETTARQLMRMADSLSPDDYLLARVLTEHPQAPPELLERLASHPYAAVRENVARHPHTSSAVLRGMAKNSVEPLWFLVACNPSTPPELRERLREKMRQLESE
jgi:hypothetical protein